MKESLLPELKLLPLRTYLFVKSISGIIDLCFEMKDEFCRERRRSVSYCC